MSTDPNLPTSAAPPGPTSPAGLAIIPRPRTIQTSPGAFQLRASTRILACPNTGAVAHRLAASLASALGLSPRVVELTSLSPTPSELTDSILLRLDNLPDLGNEGYRLTVSPSGAELSANHPTGLHYACETLRQILSPEAFAATLRGLEPSRANSPDASPATLLLPCVTLEDSPRFPWRGHLFDSCRHFFPVCDLKRALDLMAVHKMNRFHWHLTEDQGWRLEIRRYPRLTEVGAWRTQLDGTRYGGFYTQEEVREVVAYAAERQIVVVPEIEMPGHSLGALAAYPEFGCTGGPYTVQNDWGIFPDVYCAGRDETFTFLTNILDEVLELFPSEYIHIGGDECPKDRWKTCPRCQERIRTEHLQDEHELQSWFIRRIDDYLTRRGRRLIGWDEILEGGLAPGAVVQSWRGMDGGIAAATAGHDVIMSPHTHTYLDYSYLSIPLEKAYAFEPVPPQLPPAAAPHVLGLEGNMWTEWVPDRKGYDFQVYPRLCALAEVAWTPTESRQWEDFRRRMDVHGERLRRLGVEPGVPEELSLENCTIAGHWTPDQMRETGADLEWDLTPHLRAGEPFEIIFWFTSGTAGVRIEGASLHQDGGEIQRDSHLAWSGNDKRAIVYRFKPLPADSPPAATYTLRARLKPIGGTDSTGNLLLRPGRPADPQAVEIEGRPYGGR